MFRCNVNFNINLKLLLRLFMHKLAKKKTLTSIKMHGMYVKTIYQCCLFPLRTVIKKTWHPKTA